VSVYILSRWLCESDLNIAIDRFYQIYYDVHIPAGFSSFPAHNVWFVVASVQYSSRCLSYSSRVLPLVNTHAVRPLHTLRPQNCLCSSTPCRFLCLFSTPPKRQDSSRAFVPFTVLHFSFVFYLNYSVYDRYRYRVKSSLNNLNVLLVRAEVKNTKYKVMRLLLLQFIS
jgi:hypothetical protein